MPVSAGVRLAQMHQICLHKDTPGLTPWLRTSSQARLSPSFLGIFGQVSTVAPHIIAEQIQTFTMHIISFSSLEETSILYVTRRQLVSHSPVAVNQALEDWQRPRPRGGGSLQNLPHQQGPMTYAILEECHLPYLNWSSELESLF